MDEDFSNWSLPSVGKGGMPGKAGSKAGPDGTDIDHSWSLPSVGKAHIPNSPGLRATPPTPQGTPVGTDDTPYSNPWDMAKTMGKQFLGGAIDAASALTNDNANVVYDPTQPNNQRPQPQNNSSVSTNLGLGPVPGAGQVRALGSLAAPSPNVGGVSALEGGMGPVAPAASTAGQTAGQVTGSPGLQGLESTLGRLPGGAPIRQAVTQQKNDLTNGVQTIVDNLAGGKGTTPYSVGTALDKGITQGAKDLKATAGAPFDDLDAKLATANVFPKTTQAFLKAATEPLPGAANLGARSVDPTLAGYAEDLKKDMDANAGFVPYGALKSVMQRINQKIDWTGVNGDASNGALKQFYLAMRNDLNDAATTAGMGKEVAVAKAGWSDAKGRLDALNNALSGNGGPEQIFNRLVSGAKAGPSGLSNVMDVLSDSNQKLLAAGMLQKMGKAPGAAQNAAGDAFDADTFFRNWGNMDPDAKNRLFGSLPQDYRQSLDKLVQNANALKAYTKVLPNASNTAQAAVWAGSFSTAITSLLMGHPGVAAGAAGAALSTNVISRALTNPRIVKYLAQKSDPSRVLGIGAKLPPVMSGMAAAQNQSAPTSAPDSATGTSGP